MTDSPLMRQPATGVRPLDVHPDLARTMHTGALGVFDHWTCRECGCDTPWVVIVPVPRAWRHAVDPYCSRHFPEGKPKVWTRGWPGPSTLPLYARQARLEAQ